MPLSLCGRSSPRRSRKKHSSEDEPNTAKSDEPLRKSWSRSLSRTSSRLTRSLSALSLGRSRSDVTASSSVSDTREAEDRFEVLEEIGRGAFSTVVLARKRQPPDEGCLFAMKVCQKKEPGKKDRRKPPNSKAEPFILGFLQSKGGPFVIDLRYAFQAQDSFYLVTDYFSRGSLETLLKRRQVSLDSCVAAFAELVVALTFLHAHGVVHRDCKPSNVLIDDQVRFPASVPSRRRRGSLARRVESLTATSTAYRVDAIDAIAAPLTLHERTGPLRRRRLRPRGVGQGPSCWM